jgi:hypothetical protein
MPMAERWQTIESTACAARIKTSGKTWLRIHDELVQGFNQATHIH